MRRTRHTPKGPRAATLVATGHPAPAGAPAAPDPDPPLDAPRQGVVVAPTPPREDGEDLSARIARRAYERFLARGREHGKDRQDWLEAEEECRSMQHRT